MDLSIHKIRWLVQAKTVDKFLVTSLDKNLRLTIPVTLHRLSISANLQQLGKGFKSLYNKPLAS